MSKKIIIASIVFIFAGMTIMFFATGFISKKSPPEEKRVSRLYRGMDTRVHSISEVNQMKSRYVFEPVLQYDQVEHDFIIKNNSDAPLVFKKVSGCCGCLVTSHSSQIDPGLTGKISTMMITDQRGGSEINGTITAVTDDKDDPELTIDISCYVRKIASITPYKIMLDGPAGHNVEGTCTIIPEENFPFHITGIKPKKGFDISFSYMDFKKDGRKGYLVNVKRTRKETGIFRDILFIQTDNPERPEFKIRIQGTVNG